MRRFEYVDEKSNKYWEIEVQNTEVLTRYGRIDTTGQETIKSFASNTEADLAAMKLITSKLKKGYQEV